MNRRITTFRRVALLAITTGVCFAAAALADGRVGNVKDDGSQFVAKDGVNSQWKVGARLCVLHASQVIACGTATERTSDGLAVVLDANSTEISAGDVVRLEGQKAGKTKDISSVEAPAENAYETGSDNAKDNETGTKDEAAPLDDEGPVDPGDPNKKPVIIPPSDSSEPLSDQDRIRLMQYHRAIIDDQLDVEAQETHYDEKIPTQRFNISVGAQLHLNAGNSFVWPTIYFQAAVSRHYSLGLSAGYVQYQVLNFTNTAPELYGVLEAFPMEIFEGIFIRVGAGLSDNSATFTSTSGSTSTTTQLTQISFSAHALIGWRFYIQSGVSLAVSAGASYYKLPGTFANASGSSSGTSIDVVQPMGLVELGIRF